METGLSLIVGPMFSGKCVDPDTLICGTDGMFYPANEFKVGDHVPTPNGIAKVKKIVRGFATMYEIKTDYHSLLCTLDHKLCLMDAENRKYEMTVKKYLELSDKRRTELFMYKQIYHGNKSKDNEIEAINSYEAGINFMKNHVLTYEECDDDTANIINIATSSIKSRLDFIIGCIDKFGCVDEGWYHIPVVHENMQKYVIHSLGGISEVYIDSNYIKYIRFKNGKFVDLYTKKGTIKGDFYSKTSFSVCEKHFGKYIGIQLEKNHKMFDSMFYITHNSTELIRQVKRFNLSGKKVLVLKSNIDDRYSAEPQVITHDKTTYDCLKIDDLKNVYDLEAGVNIVKDYDVIAIDEGQFIKNLYIADILASTHYVIIAGLDADFKKNSFKSITELVPKAEHVLKLSAICKCGKEAYFTKKHIAASEEQYDQVSVGGADQYIPVCRKCHSF